MRLRFGLVFILFLFILGCNSAPSSMTASNKMYEPKGQVHRQNTSADIKIIKEVTKLKPGDIGIITIHGDPGVTYNAKSTFSLGNRTYRVTQLRTADRNGIATFNWVVSNESTPGTHPITISGGTKTAKTKHTVLQ